MNGIAITETTDVGALDKVMEIIPKLFDLAGTCINAVLDNPILLVFFGVSMISVGLAVFRKMKRSAR